MPEDPPVSFHELSSAVSYLNKASNELKETINHLNFNLMRLSIGLMVWILVEQQVDPDDDARYQVEQLGYAKVNGKWCIALRRMVCDDRGGPPEVREVWPFNDAPRDFRLRAVEKLPNLIEELAKKAIETAEAVNKKLQETKAFTAALMGKSPRGAK